MRVAYELGIYILSRVWSWRVCVIGGVVCIQKKEVMIMSNRSLILLIYQFQLDHAGQMSYF